MTKQQKTILMIVGIIVALIVVVAGYIILNPLVGGGGEDYTGYFLSNGVNLEFAKQNPELASDAIVCNDFENREDYINFDCNQYSSCESLNLESSGHSCSPLNPYTAQSTQLSYCIFNCQVPYASFTFEGEGNLQNCITRLSSSITGTGLSTSDYSCKILTESDTHIFVGSCRCRRLDYIEPTSGLI